MNRYYKIAIISINFLLSATCFWEKNILGGAGWLCTGLMGIALLYGGWLESMALNSDKRTALDAATKLHASGTPLDSPSVVGTANIFLKWLRS